jgi:ribosomal protein S18 acetylase RimI-like enzyme
MKYIEYNAENVNKYKSDGNMLIHARTGDDVFGTMLIDDNNKLIGYIAWQNKMIIAFEVVENYRKQGYGSKLLLKAINTGNIKRLTVSSSNKDAINLYKDFGFLETGFDYIGNRLIMTLL